MRKFFFTTFLTRGGFANLPKGTKSYFRSVFKDVSKTAGQQGKKALDQAFENNFNAQSRLRTALNAVRIVGATASTVSGIIENSKSSPTNADLKSLPYLSDSKVESLGRNEAIYYKNSVSVGKPTSRRIKTLSTGPSIEKITKTTSSTSKDYQSHKKRKNLALRSGFNEKGYTFLLEDTYFSVQDYYDLFKINERFSGELKENRRDGVKDIYGAVYETHNQFKIKNRLSNFSSHIAIHLVKIHDIRANVRSLLQEIIHNSEQTIESTNGKIPADFQYSVPTIYDNSNRFGVSFQTSLNCSLSMSQKFQEKAEIVKTWESTLPPGSIWEFNLTTHLGRGIHLNRINDFCLEAPDSSIFTNLKGKIESMTTNLRKGKATQAMDDLRTYVDDLLVKRANEHPSGFVFVFEYVGDRRASIQRVKEGDIFNGYSPVELGIEFETDVTYLVNQEKEDDLLVILYF